MELKQPRKTWPWIIGGCSLFLVIACIFTAVFGLLGFKVANQMGQRKSTESINLSTKTTPETAVLQNLQGWVEVQGETGEWILQNQGSPSPPASIFERENYLARLYSSMTAARRCLKAEFGDFPR